MNNSNPFGWYLDCLGVDPFSEPTEFHPPKITPTTPYREEQAKKVKRITVLSTHYASQPQPPTSLIDKQGRYKGLHPEMAQWEAEHKPVSPNCGFNQCPRYANCSNDLDSICLEGNVEGFLSMLGVDKDTITEFATEFARE